MPAAVGAAISVLYWFLVGLSTMASIHTSKSHLQAADYPGRDKSQGLSGGAYATAPPPSKINRPKSYGSRPPPEIEILGADRRRDIISAVIVRHRPPSVSKSKTPATESEPQAPVVLVENPADLVPGADLDELGQMVEAALMVGEGVEVEDAFDVVAGATGAKRGQVTVYTRAVQKRFREAVLVIGHLLVPLRRGRRNGKPMFFHPASFITLTYHKGHVPDAETCDNQIDRFIKRFRRRFPRAFGLRVREFQLNGSLHHQWVVHWGEDRWTEPWKVRHDWVRENWADVVAREMGPDPDHFMAGTQVSAVISAKAIADYVAKGGVQKLQPGAAVAADFTKRAQKAPPADHLVGHKWWDYINREAYDREARRCRVQVAPDVARAIDKARRESWERFFERKGVEVEPWKIPGWASGRHSDEILAAAGARRAVLSASWENVLTGEVDDGEVFDPSALRMAAAISAGNLTLDAAAEQIVAQRQSPPSVAAQVVPALWMPLGSPPLSRGGLSLVRPPGAGPPRPRPPKAPPTPVSVVASGPFTRIVFCPACGDVQLRLKAGLCVHCDGTLPRGSGRKAVWRGAEPRRETENSLFGPV